MADNILNIGTVGSTTPGIVGDFPPNEVCASPASGPAGALSVRALVAADIPALTLVASDITSGQVALARGGTAADLSATGGTHQVLKQSSTGAVITVGQLAFSDISGSVAATQLPNPSASTLGGVESYAAVTHQFLTSISVSGVPASAQPSFSDISGTITTGQQPSTTVNSVVNDTNVTGSITAQALTLGWTGTLAKGRTLATTVYTDQANTFGSFLQKFKAGTNFDLVDPTDTTKVAQFDLSNISTATTRTVNVPDANSTTVQSSSAASHQFATGVSAQGVVSYAQPSFTDISGSVAATQLPNPSATTLGGIESAAAQSHKWINSISTSGVPSLTQPAVADLSDGTVGSGTHVVMATTVTGSGTQVVLGVNPSLSGASLVGTTIFGGTAVPDVAGGENIGSTSLPFGNVYVGAAATNNNKITSATTTAARTFTLPDADSNPVQPSSAGSHQFATAIASTGVITWTQPAFTDISGTAASGQYVTMVGDSGSGGTKGAVPAPASGDAAAGKFLKANGTWAVPAGGGGGITNTAATSIVPVTADVSGNLATSPIWANSTEVRIGSTTNIGANASRLYVFGGTNGCNIDVQADGSTAGSDVAQVEVEGSDYATHVNSIAIRYFGPTALGTFCGITAQSVGVLDFIGSTTTAGIIRTGGSFPLVFGTNDVERLRINATGESKFSSSLAITGAINVSQVAAPSAPTVAPHNGSASTWQYKIVAYDNNNQPTTGSTAGQTTTGAATLDSTHWNQITWSEVAGASYYKVFRTTVATSPTTTGVIGTVNSGSTMTLRDNGLAGDSSSVPTANTTGEVTVPAIVCNGPLIQSLVTKTASYSLTVNDRIVLVNSASSTTMTLPVTGSAGQEWTIKNINTGTCTIQGASGNVESSASVTLNPSNSFDVVFDGTNFWII